MHFPVLNNLNASDLIKDKMDVWFASRREAVKRSLTTLQFAIDMEVDEDSAVELFDQCVAIGLLEKYYVLECSQCQEIIGIYNNPDEIPEQYHCEDCGTIGTSRGHIAEFYKLISEARI